MKDIEKIIEEVNATMSMEGMPIKADDRDRIRLCLRDKKLFDETLKNLVNKHSVPKLVKNSEGLSIRL